MGQSGHRAAGRWAFLVLGFGAVSAGAQSVPVPSVKGAPSAPVASARPAASAVRAPPPAPMRAVSTAPSAVPVAPAPGPAAAPPAAVVAAPPAALPGPSVQATQLLSEPSAPVEVLAPPPAPSISAAPPAPSASAAPAPSASAGAEPKAPEASAKVHDTVVFTLRTDAGGRTVAQRARAASEALSRAVGAEKGDVVRVERRGDLSTVFAGGDSIIDLYPEDAEAAKAASLDAYAETVAGRVREVVQAEKQRSAIAGTVFSVSLLVFFGLVAFYVLQKLGEFFEGLRKWTIDNPDRVKGLRVQQHEVVGPTAIRGAIMVALILGRFVAQIGVVYVWLVFAFSLFESTRPLTAKLTGIVVTPLSELAGRVAASLPLAVVGVVSGVALYVLLRFVQLFFEGVARRQTTVPWLPADLASSTSVLIRVGIVVTAFVFAAPIVTGDAEGALSRAGLIALLALGLSATPLVASCVVGAVVVFGRRVRVGQDVEMGGRTGRVAEVGLVDVRVVDSEGCDVRIPHLLALVHPTRTVSARSRVTVEISLAPHAPLREAQQVLLDAASELGDKPLVELAFADARASTFQISISGRGTSASEVRLALLDAVALAGFTLGRARESEVPR